MAQLVPGEVGGNCVDKELTSLPVADERVYFVKQGAGQEYVNSARFRLVWHSSLLSVGNADTREWAKKTASVCRDAVSDRPRFSISLRRPYLGQCPRGDIVDVAGERHIGRNQR